MRMTCKRCDYWWFSRILEPRCCPECHSHKWREPKPADTNGAASSRPDEKTSESTQPAVK